MKRPYLSIVIPTYNRAEQLDRALGHLYEQELAHESFEVIVVDDGSMDETDKVLKAWKAKWPQLQSLHQSNSGQATARNRGIKKASGQVILFGQDDIYASPGFLAEHIRYHQEHPDQHSACLGLTEWWTELEVTPYMNWLTSGGPQFAYHKLTPGEPVSPFFFYTSNISLKAELLKKNLFDETFKGYGWEDVELGYRLMKLGLELEYVPSALAWHDHSMTPMDLEKRMVAIGKGAVLLNKKAPELGILPSGGKLLIMQVGTLWGSEVPFMLLGSLIPSFKRATWMILSKRYFLRGIRSV